MAASTRPPVVDPSFPNVARMYDYMLFGRDNLEVDRTAVHRVLRVEPTAVWVVRENRAYLGRAVRHLTEACGLRQSIDHGSGLPTRDNVHEVAQRYAPDARVVYVDRDPVVLAHGQALEPNGPREAWRPVLRLALLSALAIATYETALLILAPIVLVAVVVGVAVAPPGRRAAIGRRAALLLFGLPAALVLLLPWSMVLFTSASPLRDVGAALVTPDFVDLVQLLPGGAGAPAFLGPLYVLLGLLGVAFAGALRRMLAFWLALGVLVAAALAAVQTLGVAPHVTDWPGGVLIPGAVAWAAVVGIGLTATLPALARLRGGAGVTAPSAGRRGRADRDAAPVATGMAARIGAAGMAAVAGVLGVTLVGVLGIGSWPLETGAEPLPATVTESGRRVLWLAGGRTTHRPASPTDRPP